MSHYFLCTECGRRYPLDEVRYRCDCDAPLEIARTEPLSSLGLTTQTFDARLTARTGPQASGVWRFSELLPPFSDQAIVSRPEGNTNLYSAGASERGGLASVGRYAGLETLLLKHEGENPTGSFKDRGMTVGITQAVSIRAKAVACASTGNTSASLASYAAQAGLPCFVFVPHGKIASAKLAQSLGYGAITLQIRGDFDAAMKLVEEVCARLGVYLLNSINPFRIEGQKTIGLELLQQLGWQPPDWIVLPAGNLGNTAALGKALREAREAGLISSTPRIASIQAAGANPFYRSYTGGFAERFRVEADTIATAIKIGNPVSYGRARDVIRATGGVVTEVTDEAILEAKAVIDRAGIGCEPASAASLAGARRLVQEGVIQPGDRTALILTGHILKDPETTFDYHMSGPGAHGGQPVAVEASFDAVRATIESYLASSVAL